MLEEKFTIIEIENYALDLKWEEPEYRLAHLLAKDVIFLNNGHWIKDWPKDHITLHVNCNDIFMWGCADSEDITYSEIDDLYTMWKKDENWGPAAWCIKKRKAMPQQPVIEIFKKQGVWDLDKLIKGDI